MKPVKYVAIMNPNVPIKVQNNICKVDNVFLYSNSVLHTLRMTR